MALIFKYNPYCKQCGTQFGARRKTATFCSGKCQKRYERSLKPRQNDGLTRYQRSYNTKCDKLEERPCSGCRAKFFVNGNNKMKKFHSRSCQRKAKRFEKSFAADGLASPNGLKWFTKSVG